MAEMTGTVLVVENDITIGQLISKLLTTEGHTVEVLADAMEALDAIKQKGTYQVIISDIKMPNMNGLKLLTEVKKIDQFAEVILMTGYGSFEIALKCKDSGAHDLILKDQEDFRDALRESVKTALQKVKKWKTLAKKMFAHRSMDQSDIL